MLDTMTATKVVGALCGSLLVFLLGGWVAESLYHTGGGHGAAEQAYLIETDSADEGPADAQEDIDFAALVAEGDIAKGEKVFNKCKACHKLDGTDGTGPHLNGVVDRQIAAVSGFGYSDALAEKSQDKWDADHLNAFLESPKGYAPGTKMSFSGLKKPADRANLVAYLQSLDG